MRLGDFLDGWGKAWAPIIDALKGHPEKLLAAVMVFAGGGLLIAGVHPIAAVGLPVTIYVAYLGADLVRNTHKERMAQINLKRIETTIAKPARQRARKALERRQGKNEH